MANWYDNVPAPVDFNGREVPLDTRELLLDDRAFEVGGLQYSDVNRSWVADLVWFASKVPIDYCTMPDSWERLEKDSGSGLCEYFGMGDAEDCKGCPAYDDRLSIPCSSVMARDIIRRAKEIAGVADGE